VFECVIVQTVIAYYYYAIYYERKTINDKRYNYCSVKLITENIKLETAL